MATGIRSESIEKLRELIKGIKVAMLTTAEDDGTLRSRPMVTQETEFDGDLWFFTEMSAPKVHEAQQNRQVNVSYQAADRWISVSGTAELVGDRRKINKLWHPAYKAYFPNGKDDPSIGLIKVKVYQAEYWEAPYGVATKLLGFTGAVTTGDRSGVSDNRKLDLNR